MVKIVEKVQVGGNLPEGWKTSTLGKLTTVVRGSSPRPQGDTRYYGGKVPRLMVADVTRDGMFVTPKIDFLTDEGAKLSRPMKKGDVVMVVSGAPGLPGILAVDSCIHDGFVGFRDLDTKRISNTYLFHYLKYVHKVNDAYAAGAIFRNLTTDQIKEFEINYPPLFEQKQIVEILSDRLSAVEKARAATEAQLAAAKALPAAYLRQVFDSPEAQKWPRNSLGDVADIGSGITLGRKLKNPTRKVAYLRVANVKDGYLDLSNVYDTDATETEIEKCLLEYGDILLTEGGDPDKLGRGTFWEEQIKDCIHQNHIFRVRFDLNRFCPKFISFQIGSPYGKAYFLEHAKQTTGIATINKTILSGFPLMIPRIAKQKSVVAGILTKLSESEKLQNSLQSQLDTINQIPSALLRQAFNGEL